MQSVALPEVLEVALVARRGMAAISLVRQRRREIQQATQLPMRKTASSFPPSRMPNQKRPQSKSPRQVLSVEKGAAREEVTVEERAEERGVVIVRN